MKVRFAVIADAKVLRNWLLDGISRPFVGSSRISSEVFEASPKESRNFFFCPYENSLSFLLKSRSKDFE